MRDDQPTVTAREAADDLADDAVALVEEWVGRAGATGDRDDRVVADRLARLIEDPGAVAFTMRFVDRVARPESDRAAAHQLSVLVRDSPLPSFLSPLDRVLLTVGGWVAPVLPGIVMPLARRRMRALVGHLVADAEPERLGRHLAERRAQGYRLNVNLLGEAILGEDEAQRRFTKTLDMIRRPDVDYVSVKISSVASQLSLWAYEASLERIVERLRILYDTAASADPPTFVNLDMEEYEDLDLTIDAFIRLLDRQTGLDAGIVLQAYLPDTYPALRRLTEWANRRHGSGGGTVKIRLVKGANLAMERVDAEIHGWPQAPYETKVETDANYKRCLDWVMEPERLRGVQIGVASHNLFDVAWAHLLSRARDVEDRVEFEMLQGMAPAHSSIVRADTGSMLLYTPVVAAADFDVAIGYLFRRLEENAASDNFLRALFSLEPGSDAFRSQEEVFRTALAQRWAVSDIPRRAQDRTVAPPPRSRHLSFSNEADTDPSVPANRRWAQALTAARPSPLVEPLTTTTSAVDDRVAIARRGAADWSSRPAEERRRVLLDIADELAASRGDLVTAMVHEASKTVAEADPEVSEAIDFARYYADRALETEVAEDAAFTPLGVVTVIPPWNFPVAIPAGGVLASLAAGNAVLFKPAPETPRCAEIVAEACWAAAIPSDVLQFVRTPDDETGRRLVTHPDVDGVILTGSWETGNLFRAWKPELRLFAETSGKNSLVVTPHADLDLAAADLVKSAFGHSGQKCSAASLGILVGAAFTSERFRRQLVDAARSMRIGPSQDLATVMGPVIKPVEGPLEQALTDRSATWLLEPRRLDENGRLWSPGIIDDVQPGSWFHHTECFGPVLGLLAARDLAHAIELQNAPPYGLTGGIHTLDPREVETWLDQVQVGNAYVNRHITGAVVRRQSFGGWKRSVIGPGAKAGGPNYVRQLGRWHSDDVPARPTRPEGAAAGLLARLGEDMDEAAWLARAATDDQWWWEREFGIEHDPSGLMVESNVFRYRPRLQVVIRSGEAAEIREVLRAALAAARAGTPIDVSSPRPQPGLPLEVTVETDEALVSRMPPWSRIRCVGIPAPELRAAAREAEVDLRDEPVAASGRIEMLHYLREQAVSRTLHRLGNLIA